ncbi:Holliday junction resolvase RuvX [Ferruginibacter lapsinanis]|uniref:Holliday junction resolvase RuvX n=1 Tax=Ferruginibacter lapsinanis TaxID=563172 RepID=UPI001E285E3B|nr:Holliday junction resolvase RuvX [Ferruginibacter lapsinanis]UEG48743.1 Holliday junction resolvase RuvX [Ferruginibacter lapsinanis]
MARILAIDYGGKRTGLAVTDPLQIIATGLTTIDSKELIPFLKNYIASEEVELIIIGLPKNWDESDTHGTPLVEAAIKKIKKEFPAIPLKTVDERYTSKMAKDAMLEMGMKKKDRRIKGNVDVIAATIILQEYLQSIA